MKVAGRFAIEAPVTATFAGQAATMCAASPTNSQPIRKYSLRGAPADSRLENQPVF